MTDAGIATPGTDLRLKIRQMALLLALDQTQNLHQAARQTHMSQPAASKMLRDIEALFGVPFFDRLPRGVRPTPYGATMIRHVRMAMANLEQGRDAVAALRAGSAGQVNIGTILTASTTLVPQALVRTKAIAPGLCMQVQVDTSDQLLRRLSMGQLDFLIARLQSQDDEADMAYEDLSDETACAVARPQHPLRLRKELTLSELATCGWILSPRGSILRHRFDMMFRRAHLEPPANVIESTVMTLVTSLLQQTDFLHVMPLDVARFYVQSGQMALLPITLPCRMDSFGIITRRDQLLSPGASLLLQQVREVAAEIYGDAAGPAGLRPLVALSAPAY
jgi:DNA-binding transcriptional LysR family regulator